MVWREGAWAMCSDELGCITEAVGMYQSIFAEAEAHAISTDGCGVDPEIELRARLPLMLGQLSPAARARLRDHLRHTAELVAFVHRTAA